MKDWVLRWLGIQPSSQNNAPDATALLVESYKSHIADLQKEVERLQALVQVLSDDKFFKPQVIPQNAGPVESTVAFEPNDFVFETPADPAPVAEEEPVDFQAEFDSLQKEFATYQSKRGIK